MATLARDGLFKKQRLFIEQYTSATNAQTDPNDITHLPITENTLQTLFRGMSAVVNESGGTAYEAFEPVSDYFSGLGVSIYGKTGSTEQPDVAWFAGFAKDTDTRSIAIAVVVEGGQHGSSDAAPIARDIIQFCIEAEYIGKTSFLYQNPY